MNKRKITIFIISLVIMLAVFFIFNGLSDNSSIDVVQEFHEATVVEHVGKFDGQQAGEIGDAVIGETSRSEYKMWDDNKRLTRKFGFEKLLHSEGQSWDVLSPFMNIYEKQFRCFVTSEKGYIRIEKIAGKPMPAEAQLSKNVLIEIQPLKDNGSDIKIFLEDLNFNSERSEFSTDGPVLMVSSKATMTGYGLSLIYNSTLGRIEFLKIRKLDELVINDYDNKNEESPALVKENAVASNEIKKTAVMEKVVSSEPLIKSENKQDGCEVKVAKKTQPQKTVDNIESQPESKQLYRCEIDRNVVITTSDDQKITADLLVINNFILGSNTSQKSSVADEKSITPLTPVQPKEIQIASAKKTVEISQSPKTVKVETPKVEITKLETPVQEESSQSQSKQIVLTCDGSLILMPLDSVIDAETNQNLEFFGSPVNVTVKSEPVVKCAKLKYNIDEETMQLSCDIKHDNITLTMPGQEGTLRTNGNVFWDRKSNFARIVGPGNIELEEEDKAFNIDFLGLMDVEFAQTAEKASEDLLLKSLEISGGMQAVMKDTQIRKIASDWAKLDFVAEEISHVDLNGAVLFADSSGELTSNQAEVFFGMSDANKNEPYKVIAKGDASLKPAKTETGPTYLNAQSIEYDLLREFAIAQGPVSLNFSFPSRQSEISEKLVPVTVTAERNAEFDVVKNQVVFNDNVHVDVKDDQVSYMQLITLDASQMTIDLLKDSSAQDESKVKRFYATGEPVKLKSTKEENGEIIQKVVLASESIEYDGITELISSGAGKIEFDNSKAPPSKDQMKGPTYGIVEDFASLKWDTVLHKVSAFATDDEIVHMGVVPVLADGTLGTQKLMDAGKIDIQFIAKDDGKLEPSTLYASKSVLYEEPGVHQFVGDKLSYDAVAGVIAVRGSKNHPCMLDSGIVDGIDYDLTTGDIKTRLGGASIFR